MKREQELLAMRARVLAKPVQIEIPEPAAHSYLVFVVSGKRFALETQFVWEVTKLRRVLRVPGALPHLRGITVVRGEQLTVLDVARYVGAQAGEKSAAAFAVVCGKEQHDVVIAADDILDFSEIDVGSVIWSENGRGLAPDGTIVLDGHVLFDNLRLF